MAWSYRSDLCDEIYHDQVGVALVEAEKLPATPKSSADAKEMLEEDTKKGKVKEGIVTEFQEFPGQNVPRVIEGDGTTEKDKEIVEAAKARDKNKDNVDPVKAQALAAERERIRYEELNKAQSEEMEKEREKMRHEVQAEIKKSEKPAATPANNKK